MACNTNHGKSACPRMVRKHAVGRALGESCGIRRDVLEQAGSIRREVFIFGAESNRYNLQIWSARPAAFLILPVLGIWLVLLRMDELLH